MDAITLLKQDHRTVEALFRRYESGLQGQEKQDVVHEIIRELSVHAAIEEQVLYPAVRRAFPKGEDLAEEGIDEHQEVKETLSDLDGMDPSEPGFDPKVRSLIGDVRHHVEEEEGEMFPKLAQALSSDRLDEMGSAMEGAKRMAPTRPHPLAPSTPPGNIVAGPVAGVVDRARDAVTGRSRKKSTARKKTTTRKRSTAKKKSTAKRSTAKKASARKKTTSRKPSSRTTTRKPASRKKTTTRKKATLKKPASRKKATSSRKTTRRKPATRKSSTRKRSSATRKPSTRKSSSRKRTTSR